MDFSLMNQLASEDNLYLIPDYLKDKKAFILSSWESLKLKNHIFLFSSGTTSKENLKSYSISKEALFHNAKAVNNFLEINSDDVWLASLPPYHIGGLSIYARAYLSKSKVVECSKKWDAKIYCQLLIDNKISFFSLVPRQLYDIIKSELRAPSCLRGVFVGGDFLATSLAKKAIELGWPIIQTYGMTELASQIATSYYKDMDDGFMEVLPIHQIIGNNIQSSSLYSGQGIFNNNTFQYTPVAKGSFKLPDSFLLKNNGTQFIKPLGRLGDEFKLKGRLINFLELKNVIHNILIKLNLYDHAEVMLVDDLTYGSIVEIYAEHPVKTFEDQIIKLILEDLPFLKDALVFRYFDELPKTGIGKIKHK